MDNLSVFRIIALIFSHTVWMFSMDLIAKVFLGERKSRLPVFVLSLVAGAGVIVFVNSFNIVALNIGINALVAFFIMFHFESGVGKKLLAVVVTVALAAVSEMAVSLFVPVDIESVFVALERDYNVLAFASTITYTLHFLLVLLLLRFKHLSSNVNATFAFWVSSLSIPVLTAALGYISKMYLSAYPVAIVMILFIIFAINLASIRLHDALAKTYGKNFKLAAAQAQSDAKSKFLAHMSHEIRTPIAAVIGISEIHSQEADISPEAAKEAFAKIRSSGNTLLGIVNEILDLSKIESGKMEIASAKYNVASLLTDTTQLNLAYLGDKKLDFVVEVDENLPAALIGDELRIKQVLNNLLSNAFKYTVEGSVTLEVRGNSAFDDFDIFFTVRDTGLGMSEEQIRTLFDEYTRFHTESCHVVGIGLGMNITNNLLKLMNAKIHVESEVNKGTTVTICIPQKIASQEVLGAKVAENLRKHKISVPEKPDFTPEPMPHAKVLVVDDMETNLYVAKGLLSPYRLQVETCNSGPEAIEKINRGEKYDIIFMDQFMPQMNGTETVIIIRGLNYTGSIVALTADALVGQDEKFLNNGFDGFLSKPIQTEQLNAILRKFITTGGEPAAPRNQPDRKDSVMNDMALGDLYGLNEEISAAYKTGDWETIHRCVHTVKSLAGLIDEPELVNIAQEAETAISAGGKAPVELITALQSRIGGLFA